MTSLPDLKEPQSYPPAEELTASCSLVMKGGITSGIIYPRAVCQIATTRRLVHIGGTSAGAIAAGAAAAAEFARNTGAHGRRDIGYPRLAALPHSLTENSRGHSKLYQLFQPQAATRALYRLVTVWIGRGGKGRKRFGSLIRALLLTLRPLPSLVALVFAAVVFCGVVVCGVVRADHASVWPAVALAFVATLALIATLAVAVVCVACSLWIRVGKDLPANNFGLCSGMGSPSALTEWLAAEINGIAGKDPNGPPLTFGELNAAGIKLSMLTTDLTSRTQNELPFTSPWAFKPGEFTQLFPPNVVRHLIDRSPEPAGDPVLERFRNSGFYALPPAPDIPVIVGVRMSLSFPPLLSTVPLHAIDYTRDNEDKPTISDPDTAAPAEHPIVCHRFSDGGITSNFPLHFFDAAIPDRPTFGINLVEIGDSELSDDRADNVWMPTGNNQGSLTRPHRIDTTGDFVHAILDTMQNWADSMQGHAPGYRDRIVAVEHTKTEGGLNLDMDARTILGLAERGQYAGSATQAFDFTNHRWLRFRSLLQTLEEFIAPTASRLRDTSPQVQPSYEQMINSQPPYTPPSYRHRWADDAIPAAFTKVKAALANFGDTFNELNRQQAPYRPITEGAPRAHPKLQVRPRPLS
jgi:Patatin-like phospholipase